MVTISNALLEETIDEHGNEIQQSVVAQKEVGPLELAHDVLDMANGMIGFEQVKQYSIKAMEGNIIYQMIGQPEFSPTFFLINPYLVVPHYELSMSDEEYELLGKPEFDDIIVFVTLTFEDSMEDTTCNLLGPLVINNKDGVMLQVVNDAADWGTKHLISTGEKVVAVRVTTVEE